jgi:RHS repeat-associated protein
MSGDWNKLKLSLNSNPSSSITYQACGRWFESCFRTEQNGLLGLYSDTTGGVTTYYTHLPTGAHQAIGETIGSTAYYYLTDMQGSTAAVSDINGNVQDTYSYDPYGNLLASTGTIANPYRYDNGYYDLSTGLYKFGERYYSPGTMRWTQLDPSGQNPGYVFAGDDPVNEFDPTGTNFLSSAFGIASFVAGTAITYTEGAAVGGAAGALTGCVGGFVFTGFDPLGCAAGGIIYGDEGATVGGISNAVHYDITGQDSFSY